MAEKNLPSGDADESDQPTAAHVKKGGWLDFLFGELPLQNPTVFFILANVLDIFCTYIMLRYDAIEANPFANFVLIQWGFWGMISFKLLIVAMVCIIAQVIALKKLNTARVLLWVGTLIVGAVVVYSMLMFSLNFRGQVPSF